MSFRPLDEHSASVRLLVVTERLYDAIAARDGRTVGALLDSRAATSIPREVREEALSIVGLPPGSYRVPMSLLRFHHRLTELARSDEEVEGVFRSLDAEWHSEEEMELGDDLPADAPPTDPAQMEFRLGWEWRQEADTGRSMERRGQRRG